MVRLPVWRHAARLRRALGISHDLRLRALNQLRGALFARGW